MGNGVEGGVEVKLRWLAQHDTDKDEIQRLNQALFDRNNQSIENLKVWGLVWRAGFGGKLRWLAQHDTDRDEIQRLNQALFDRIRALRTSRCGDQCGTGAMVEQELADHGGTSRCGGSGN